MGALPVHDDDVSFHLQKRRDFSRRRNTGMTDQEFEEFLKMQEQQQDVEE